MPLVLLWCVIVAFLALGPEVIKLFSCLTQLSTKLQLHIKLKFRQMEMLLALSLSDVVFIILINVKNAINYWHFNIYEQVKFRAQLS